MSSRPFESPPPYRPDEFKPSNYAPSNNTYGGEFHSQPMFSQPAYSYYPEEEVQHFYKWTSPPGIIKIMSIFIIVMCVGVFACVASTLAWDLDMYGSSLGTGMGYPNYGSSGFGGSYGYGYGSYGYGGSAYGIGGNYIEPRAAKGFILAMTAFCFIAGLVVFVTSVTKNSMARTTKYYLIIIIGSALLLFLMFIATIVYVLAVNPTAQSSGSVFYNQIYTLCSQFYTPTSAGLFVNQYLYHYCVVEPQEAIAIVLGFLIVVAFIVIIFFAVKTRNKMNHHGKMNILWDNTKDYEEAPNVEEWVKNINTEPSSPMPATDYPDRIASSMAYSASDVPAHRVYPENNYRSTPMPDRTPVTIDPVTKQSPYANTSSYSGSAQDPAQKRKARRLKRNNGDNYDADYTTGGESCDELEEDWDREYPAISSDHQRQTYKRDFDAKLQEYKRLQAELDEITKELAHLDKALDDYSEDSEEHKVAAEEYNRLKDIKASTDYKSRKEHCKRLKSKLAHIKRMVTDYDSRKS